MGLKPAGDGEPPFIKFCLSVTTGIYEGGSPVRFQGCPGGARIQQARTPWSPIDP